MLRRPLQCVTFQYDVCDSTYVALVLANAACLTYVERAAMSRVSQRPPGQADARQGGEDDLDALLAHFQLSDKRQKEVQVLGEAPPPSPRVFATWTAVPTQVQPFPLQHGMHGLSKSTV